MKTTQQHGLYSGLFHWRGCQAHARLGLVQRVVGEDDAVAGQQASRGDGRPPCAGGGQQCLLARGEAKLVSEDEDRA